MKIYYNSTEGYKIEKLDTAYYDMHYGAPPPYTEVEYIQHDNTHKGTVILDVTPTINTRTQVGLYFSGNDGSSYIGQQSGSYGIPDNQDYRLFVYQGNWYFDLQNERLIGPSAAFNTWHDIEFGNNYIKNTTTGTILVQGTQVSSIAYPDAHFWLFTTAGTTTCRFSYIRCYEGETLTHNYIPVLKDGNYTMYNPITRVYCTVNGSITGGNPV